MSRYAYSIAKYQGIKFGDTAWEIVSVSDRAKQVVKALPVNTTKGSNSLVSLNGSVRTTTFLPTTSQRFFTQPAGNESPYLQRKVSDLYTASIGDFNGPQNITPPSKGMQYNTESRLQTISKYQGIPIYPTSGNVSVDIVRKDPEPVISGYYRNIGSNRNYPYTKSVAGQRNYLSIIPPAYALS
jgi:hypothetical protein